MEPLSQYEIQELLDSMGIAAGPCPIGSMWSNVDGTQMYIVLHHANMPTEQGPIPTLVLQALPDGAAWVQPTEAFLNGNWQNIGFIWDRGINV